MSTRAYYHPREIEVDLADLPTWLYRELASLHGQIAHPPSPPTLTCVGNGAPMYIYRKNGRYFARHYPGGNTDGHTHALATMSDEHRRQTDYTARAASDHGLEAQAEYSTGNGTRLDLAVTGATRTGFEIQRSTLSRATAKRRTAKSFDAGWPTAWVTDQERAPDWSGHVPTARLTAGIDWTSMPARNTAKAVIGEFTRVRDRRTQSGWAYRREPKTVLLDELAHLMPAGEIVPVAVGVKGAVALAHKSAVEVIDSCTYPGASTWRPTADTPRTREAAQRYSTACHHEEGDMPPGTTYCRVPGCDTVHPTYEAWMSHYRSSHMSISLPPPRGGRP